MELLVFLLIDASSILISFHCFKRLDFLMGAPFSSQAIAFSSSIDGFTQMICLKEANDFANPEKCPRAFSSREAQLASVTNAASYCQMLCSKKFELSGVLQHSVHKNPT